MPYTYKCKIVWYAARAGANINPRDVLAKDYPQLFEDWPSGHWTDMVGELDGETRQVLMFSSEYLGGWDDEEFLPTARLREAAEEPPTELDSEIVVLGEEWDDYDAYTNFGKRNGGGTREFLYATREIVVAPNLTVCVAQQKEN